MTFRGTYKNGVIVLDDICQLHEGQRVSVEPDPLPQAAVPSETPASPEHHSLLQKIGTAAKKRLSDDFGMNG